MAEPKFPLIRNLNLDSETTDGVIENIRRLNFKVGYMELHQGIYDGFFSAAEQSDRYSELESHPGMIQLRAGRNAKIKLAKGVWCSRLTYMFLRVWDEKTPVIDILFDMVNSVEGLSGRVQDGDKVLDVLPVDRNPESKQFEMICYAITVADISETVFNPSFYLNDVEKGSEQDSWSWDAISRVIEVDIERFSKANGERSYKPQEIEGKWLWREPPSEKGWPVHIIADHAPRPGGQLSLDLGDQNKDAEEYASRIIWPMLSHWATKDPEGWHFLAITSISPDCRENDDLRRRAAGKLADICSDFVSNISPEGEPPTNLQQPTTEQGRTVSWLDARLVRFLRKLRLELPENDKGKLDVFFLEKAAERWEKHIETGVITDLWAPTWLHQSHPLAAEFQESLAYAALDIIAEEVRISTEYPAAYIVGLHEAKRAMAPSQGRIVYNEEEFSAEFEFEHGRGVALYNRKGFEALKRGTKNMFSVTGHKLFHHQMKEANRKFRLGDPGYNTLQYAGYKGLALAALGSESGKTIKTVKDIIIAMDTWEFEIGKKSGAGSPIINSRLLMKSEVRAAPNRRPELILTLGPLMLPELSKTMQKETRTQRRLKKLIPQLDELPPVESLHSRHQGPALTLSHDIIHLLVMGAKEYQREGTVSISKKTLYKNGALAGLKPEFVDKVLDLWLNDTNTGPAFLENPEPGIWKLAQSHKAQEDHIRHLGALQIKGAEVQKIISKTKGDRLERKAKSWRKRK